MNHIYLNWPSNECSVNVFCLRRMCLSYVQNIIALHCCIGVHISIFHALITYQSVVSVVRFFKGTAYSVCAHTECSEALVPQCF